jgi:RHS repeat-associated protein
MIYLPYGELWVDEGHDTSLFPYKYTGKIQDEETGLVYFGARYYDPKISSWISTDPADRFSKNSNPISLNLYQYATLNPLRMVDPDGRLEYDSQNDSFKITKGDTLTSISKQTGFSVKELMASNKQIKNADKIQAGDKINIPTKQMKHNSDKKKSDSGANSGVELRNVSHYLGGSGDEMKLNKAEFDRIYKDGKVDGQLKPVMSKDGVFMFQGLIDLYVSDEFNYAYGNATMFFDKDMNPIGFFDRYNMNQSTHRGKLEERDTSRGRSLGSFFESKPFDIIYGKQK